MATSFTPATTRGGRPHSPPFAEAQTEALGRRDPLPKGLANRGAWRARGSTQTSALRPGAPGETEAPREGRERSAVGRGAPGLHLPRPPRPRGEEPAAGGRGARGLRRRGARHGGRGARPAGLGRAGGGRGGGRPGAVSVRAGAAGRRVDTVSTEPGALAPLPGGTKAGVGRAGRGGSVPGSRLRGAGTETLFRASAVGGGRAGAGWCARSRRGQPKPWRR